MQWQNNVGIVAPNSLLLWKAKSLIIYVSYSFSYSLSCSLLPPSLPPSLGCGWWHSSQEAAPSSSPEPWWAWPALIPLQGSLCCSPSLPASEEDQPPGVGGGEEETCTAPRRLINNFVRSEYSVLKSFVLYATVYCTSACTYGHQVWLYPNHTTTVICWIFPHCSVQFTTNPRILLHGKPC